LTQPGERPLNNPTLSRPTKKRVLRKEKDFDEATSEKEIAIRGKSQFNSKKKERKRRESVTWGRKRKRAGGERKR